MSLQSPRALARAALTNWDVGKPTHATSSSVVRFAFRRPTAQCSCGVIVHRKKRFDAQLLRRDVQRSAQGSDCGEQLQRYILFAEMYGQNRARSDLEREPFQHLAH